MTVAFIALICGMLSESILLYLLFLKKRKCDGVLSVEPVKGKITVVLKVESPIAELVNKGYATFRVDNNLDTIEPRDIQAL